MSPPLAPASSPRVVLVVPCFDEAARLEVARFERHLAGHADHAFVLVDDGSRDATRTLLQDLARRHPGRARVVALERNQGKAEAVRRGVEAASDWGALYVGYWDADLATPLEAVDEFVALLDQRPELEIVLGSRVRLLGREIERVPLRHYLGRVFATAASCLLGLGVYDTQCGAKLFRAGPIQRALFAQPFRTRWIFDIELLARYLALGRSRGVAAPANGLFELPLREWRDVRGSKLRSGAFLRVGFDLARVYWHYSRAGSAWRGQPPAPSPDSGAGGR